MVEILVFNKDHVEYRKYLRRGWELFQILLVHQNKGTDQHKKRECLKDVKNKVKCIYYIVKTMDIRKVW